MAAASSAAAGPSIEEACSLLLRNEDSLVFQIATEAPVFKILLNLLRIVSYRIIRPGRTTLRTNSGTNYQQQSRAALV